MAKARLDELKTDKEWLARWATGDKRTANEFDALTRHAMGQQQPAPAPMPDENAKALAALGPPAKPEDYKLDNVRDPVTGYPIKLDEANGALIHETLLPAAHSLGLSQSDITMIGDYIVKPMDEARCEKTLRSIWRDDYEQGIQDFGAAMKSAPAYVRTLMLDDERYVDTLQNNPALIAAIVSSYRRQKGRR
jgi:hypothetical protein